MVDSEIVTAVVTDLAGAAAVWKVQTRLPRRASQARCPPDGPATPAEPPGPSTVPAPWMIRFCRSRATAGMAVRPHLEAVHDSGV